MAEPGEHEETQLGPSDAVGRHDDPAATRFERNPRNMTEPMDSDALPPAASVRPQGPVPGQGSRATTGRHAPDILTLVVGLLSVGAASVVLAGWIPRLQWFDLRWILSGGAVVLGVLLLAASARSPRKPPR